jgi:hypothetical protein
MSEWTFALAVLLAAATGAVIVPPPRRVRLVPGKGWRALLVIAGWIVLVIVVRLS